MGERFCKAKDFSSPTPTVLGRETGERSSWGKKSDRRQRRVQGGFFGAAVDKGEAAPSAEGRAGHRKRERACPSSVAT